MGGSPGYAAPEQSRCRAEAPAHTSADIFSAGVVVFELAMAMLGPAWQTGMERARAFQALREGTLEHPGLQLPQLPLGLRTLLLWMTSPEPAGRPSAAEACRTLRGLLQACMASDGVAYAGIE